MFVPEASSRATSSGLRKIGRRRGSRVETTSSARSSRLSVTLKKNRRAVALTLTVGYRRPDRRQPQLVATDILRSGLAGRPAKEIRKAFDVADMVVLSLPFRDVRIGETEPAMDGDYATRPTPHPARPSYISVPRGSLSGPAAMPRVVRVIAYWSGTRSCVLSVSARVRRRPPHRAGQCQSASRSPSSLKSTRLLFE
jgi:hypothetical protein